MGNVDKLKALELLGQVRQVLGAEDMDDTSYDKLIDSKDSKELIGLYSKSILGNPLWGISFVELFQFLEKSEKDK